MNLDIDPERSRIWITIQRDQGFKTTIQLDRGSANDLEWIWIRLTIWNGFDVDYQLGTAVDFINNPERLRIRHTNTNSGANMGRLVAIWFGKGMDLGLEYSVIGVFRTSLMTIQNTPSYRKECFGGQMLSRLLTRRYTTDLAKWISWSSKHEARRDDYR